MQRVELRKLAAGAQEYADQQLTVAGWVRTIRTSKNLGFIELNDGTSFQNVQIVFESNKVDNFNEIGKLNVGASIVVKGTLIMTPEAKQPYEIHANEIVVEGLSTPDYPLQKKRHSVEFLRTIAHLRPRTNTFSAVFRVRSIAAFAIHKFFNERGFVYVHTPIITGSDCEGAGEMFHITTLDMDNPPRTEDGKVDYSQDFFGKPTSLTVSGQLEGECMAMAFSNIYTFGPTFRAEKSNTTRHAAEFWMMEPEIAFADLSDMMDLAEDMMKYVLSYVMENCPNEMAFFNQFYDKELLQEAAKKSGLCEKIFENFDERPKSLLYSIAMDSYMFALPGSGVGDSLEQQVYLATFNTIRHIADQGPCVIIGRCADYALADYPNHLSLFISAPLEVRIQRVAQRQNLTPEKARQLILKTDKRRASYYEYYSSKKWGSVDSYHFCIDSSYLGLGRTVELIQAMVAHKEHPIPSPTEEDPTRPRT